MKVWSPGYFVDVDLNDDDWARMKQGYVAKGCVMTPQWELRQVAEGKPWPWPTSSTPTTVTFLGSWSDTCGTVYS